MKLKRCPFCGGEARTISGTRMIRCKDCEVTMPDISSLEIPDKRWNRRLKKLILDKTN